MKKSIWTKKALSLMLVLTMAAACFAGCGEQEATPTPTPSNQESGITPIVTPEKEEEVVDLGGMDILIADWFTTSETIPNTEQQEVTDAIHEEQMKKYNFTIKQWSIGGWAEHQETFTLSTLAGTPAGQVFVMDQSFIPKPLSNGLFYDLATLDAFDFTEDKWNKSVIDLMTKGDSVYGMATGRSEPRLGVFFNKRIFEEAGIDPELPYNMQADGTWTWAAFEELCEKLTQDFDNDGVTDMYATCSFNTDFFKAAVASNNAEFIGIDENGKFYNATTDQKFIDALQFCVDLIVNGYEMPDPTEGATWNYFIAAFHDAKCAMTVAEEFKTGEWKDMEDDYGFVLFPKGPEGDYRTVFAENIVVIPSCLDEETAQKVAFAYNLYTNPIPGYDGEDDWKLYYYPRMRDSRAVDETLSMMYEEGRGVAWKLPLIYGLSYGDIIYGVHALNATPQEQVESVAATWQALIDDANR